MLSVKTGWTLEVHIPGLKEARMAEFSLFPVALTPQQECPPGCVA